VAAHLRFIPLRESRFLEPQVKGAQGLFPLLAHAGIGGAYPGEITYDPGTISKRPRSSRVTAMWSSYSLISGPMKASIPRCTGGRAGCLDCGTGESQRETVVVLETAARSHAVGPSSCGRTGGL